MKKIMRTAAVVLLATMTIVTAAMAGRRGGNQGGEGGANSGGELSSQEEIDLLFSREEEKVARDVYISLYQKWGKPVFLNISESENTHMSVVLNLIVKYGLKDPVGDNAVGIFSNPLLQGLYGDLVDAGSSSPLAAYMVGVAIEEMDVYHLQRNIEHAVHSDIDTVYENIMRGSRNHLRAFWDHLPEDVQDSYEPEFLLRDEMIAIATSPMERGR
jgi:hypothetical protein